MNIHPAIQRGDLDKDSYTAHRLHHGTPAHLHITSRRIFVGPVPTDWIKANRKDWYKTTINGCYPKRRATFSPVEYTSGARHIPNLASVPEASEESIAGSWNATTENDDVTSTRHAPSRKRSPSPVPRPLPKRPNTEPPTPIVSVSPSNTGLAPPPPPSRGLLERIQSAPEAPSLPQVQPRSAGSWHSAGAFRSPRTRSGPFGMLPLLSRPSWMASRERQDSFVTAHERWEDEDESLYTPRSQGEEGRGMLDDVLEGMVTAEGLTDEPEEVMGVMPEGFGEVNRNSEAGTQGTGNSRQMLLEATDEEDSDEDGGDHVKSDDEVEEVELMLADVGPEPISMDGHVERLDNPKNKGKGAVRWGLGKRKKSSGTARTDSTTATTIAPRTSTNLERTGGGLVRFNTGADTEERDLRAKQKLAEVSRSRSLRKLGRKYNSRKREGEIIKMDSMLVRIEAVHGQTVPDDYDENGSRRLSTRLLDKWREYVVACREGVDEHSPMTLTLYKSRVIPAIDRPHVSSRSARKIHLTGKTRVNLYSSLDKTLVVWFPTKYATMIYIMRPRCSSTAVEWYTFLQRALGEDRPRSLTISVPDLSLSLQINNPFDRLEASLESGNGEEDSEEHRVVAANLIKQSMKMLEGTKEWADIVEHWNQNEKMGLAWRRYDRLEWVHGANERRMWGSLAMEKTHELELRPKCHYPTEARLRTGDRMEEPVPIEGFLIRLTSGRGRHERLGRSFQKRLYFTTHDNYLCFCRPSRALPPRPPNPRLVRAGYVPTADEIQQELPLIYSVTPFATNEYGDIRWLHGTTPEMIEQKDKEAYDEAERRVNTLLNAEGFIDLCKVKEVRASGSRPRSDNAQEEGAAEDSSRAPEDRVFELELENGLVLALKSWNKQTRDEWVYRLNDLATYWKAREIADLAIVRKTRAENLKQLNVDQEVETHLGQYARKWEVSRTMASAEFYNVCGLSSCRAITLSGVLYRKPRRYSTFRRYAVVLCHGQLMIFRHTHRDSAGKAVDTVHQEHQLSISLRDCYIYSGLVTGSDLLYQNNTFDSNAPGHHALPRIFPDGYTSQDEDTMTCFVVWHGTRHSKFSRTDEDGKLIQHNLTQLGTTGKANVFKARSRLERDQWVMSINMEIERLNANAVEDIKVERERE